MTVWFNAILDGVKTYLVFAPVAIIFVEILFALKNKAFNPIRSIAIQMFIMYMFALVSVVFFPLPTPAQAATLTYRIQPIPMYFVYDMITKPTISGILGVIFNFLLTIPFGMFLKYVLGLDFKGVFLATLGLTVFIEIAQFTGLFFFYQGSYRLCDMDDIILNTLGGLAGYKLSSLLDNVVPQISEFAVSPVGQKKHA